MPTACLHSQATPLRRETHWIIVCVNSSWCACLGESGSGRTSCIRGVEAESRCRRVEGCGGGGASVWTCSTQASSGAHQCSSMPPGALSAPSQLPWGSNDAGDAARARQAAGSLLLASAGSPCLLPQILSLIVKHPARCGLLTSQRKPAFSCFQRLLLLCAGPAFFVGARGTELRRPQCGPALAATPGRRRLSPRPTASGFRPAGGLCPVGLR